MPRIEVEEVTVVAESENPRFSKDAALSLIGINLAGQVRLVALHTSPLGADRILETAFPVRFSTPIEYLQGVDRRSGQKELEWMKSTLTSSGFAPTGMGSFWFSYMCWRPYLPVEELRDDSILPKLDAICEQLSPHHPHGWAMRAYCHMYHKRYDTAIADANKAIALSPTYALSWFIRGKTHRELGHWQQAYDDFCKAVSIDPEDIDFLEARRDFLYEHGDPESSLADVERLVKLDPSNKDYRDAQKLIRAEVKRKR